MIPTNKKTSIKNNFINFIGLWLFFGVSNFNKFNKNDKYLFTCVHIYKCISDLFFSHIIPETPYLIQLKN